MRYSPAVLIRVVRTVDWLCWQDFILEIDSIQAHGIGAADITKLKANGFYTVAVSAFPSQLTPVRVADSCSVCSWRHTQDSTQDQGLQ